MRFRLLIMREVVAGTTGSHTWLVLGGWVIAGWLWTDGCFFILWGVMATELNRHVSHINDGSDDKQTHCKNSTNAAERLKWLSGQEIKFLISLPVRVSLVSLVWWLAGQRTWKRVNSGVLVTEMNQVVTQKASFRLFYLAPTSFVCRF